MQKSLNAALVVPLMAALIILSNPAPAFSSSHVKWDSHGKIARSSQSKRAFMRKSGHPNGWKGHEVDHRRPLKWGGKDQPSNMQWLTKKQHKAKTRMEKENGTRKGRPAASKKNSP